jgi:hypothetical protein
MPRCKAIKADGTPCGAAACHDDPSGFCIYHSKSPVVRERVKTNSPLSREKMIGILRGQLWRVRREVKNPSEQASLVLRIIELLAELEGLRAEPEKLAGFEEKLKRWKSQQSSKH